jgi:hypothetical protein
MSDRVDVGVHELRRCLVQRREDTLARNKRNAGLLVLLLAFLVLVGAAWVVWRFVLTP